MEPIYIDVREPYEFASGHVEGAINISPRELMSDSAKLEKIPKDAMLVVYCRSGSRSNTAIHLLRNKGYTHVVNGINQQHIESHIAHGTQW